MTERDTRLRAHAHGPGRIGGDLGIAITQEVRPGSRGQWHQQPPVAWLPWTYSLGSLADDPDTVLAKHGYCVAAMCEWKTANNGTKLIATVIEKGT